MGVRIDTVGLDDYERWIRATETAFGTRVTDAQLERWRALFDPERTLAAFDGDRIVGTTGTNIMELTIPGAAIDMAGVVAVGVLPTHRRRGILREMMLRQLTDSHDRGDAVAGLWASESVIYGRFGYGSAAPTAELEIERPYARFRSDPEPSGGIELVDQEGALEVVPAIYDQIRTWRPGFYEFSTARWRVQLEELEEEGGSHATSFVAVHETAGTPDGFAAYRVKRDWTDGVARGTNTVRALLATNAAAEFDLWRFCLGVDLMATVVAWPCAVDVPLWYRLADPRRLRVRIQDGLWLRFLDVPAALEARRYRGTGKLMIAVRDEVCDWVAGCYELDAGPDGATCRRSSGEPDVVLESRDLAATYLGAVRFTSLAQAGLAQGEPDALRTADAMFAWDPVAFCPFVF